MYSWSFYRPTQSVEVIIRPWCYWPNGRQRQVEIKLWDQLSNKTHYSLCNVIFFPPYLTSKTQHACLLFVFCQNVHSASRVFGNTIHIFCLCQRQKIKTFSYLIWKIIPLAPPPPWQMYPFKNMQTSKFLGKPKKVRKIIPFFLVIWDCFFSWSTQLFCCCFFSCKAPEKDPLSAQEAYFLRKGQGGRGAKINLCWKWSICKRGGGGRWRDGKEKHLMKIEKKGKNSTKRRKKDSWILSY